MPATSPSSAGTGRSILLVEDYRALAIALESALRKFAPTHQTHVAPTLAAAEAAVAELRPELLIVDIDPPQAHAVDFFGRMKFALPDTRVLIIAAGTSRKVLTARERPVAFEFIEKPFDLAELGRAVEMSLAEGGGSDTTLRAYGLADVLLLLCASSATLVLTVEGAGNRDGEIHLSSGQIVHAVAAGQVGADALGEMLRWPNPRLAEVVLGPDTARTITQAWEPLLLAAFSNSKSRLHARGRAPKEAAPAGAAGRGKKLVVIDDTELLLIFVEDVLATAEPELEIVTAGSGTEGLRQIASTKPDAVLLDFSLPDLTGDEVCRRLLEEESTADIPVVMMSGHVAERIATAARYRNVVATIAKPFLSDSLVQLVRTTLATAVVPKKTPSVAAPSPAAVLEPAGEAVFARPNEVSAPAVRERNGGHKNRDGAALLPTPVPQVSGTEPSTPSISKTSAAPVEIWHQSNETTTGNVAPAELGPKASPPQPSAPVPPVPTLEPPAPQPLATPSVATSPIVMPDVKPPRKVPSASSLQRIQRPVQTGSVASVTIPAASRNAVILGLSLEVLAIQFSRSLQMAAIRARPWSATVSLHLQPRSSAEGPLPQAPFELGHVDLNGRGQIETVRLVPTHHSIAKPAPGDRFGVNNVAILPSGGGNAMELTPASASPMTVQLFASFEVAAVELSPTFGLAALLLKSRRAEMRVTLQPDGPAIGATFKAAQVLLDREARIAEVLLDAMA